MRILFLFVTIYVFHHASIENVGSVVAFRIQQQQEPRTSASFLKIRSSKLQGIDDVVQRPSASLLYMAAGARGMSKASNSKVGSEKATGMGMGSSSATKSNKEKKGSSSTTPFNVNASLARLEKKYDELTKANAKVIRKKNDDDDDEDDEDKDESTAAKTESSSNIDDDDDDEDDENKIVTSEYVVAIRAEGYVNDWVPIAQFCLTRTSQQASISDGVTDPNIQAGISYYCRELSHVATLGSKIFSSIPRNILQYSVETLDSFHKHVYETTISTNGGSNSKNNDDPNNTNSMTKENAREVLELINGEAEDKSAIKRAYRTKSFEYHPDRFIGIDRTPEEIDIAHNKYLRIQLAYDTLNSGIRNTNSASSISWYQSLGGKARTDFVGPITLLPIENGKSILELNQIESAITCMSPSIVQTFVARCKV